MKSKNRSNLQSVKAILESLSRKEETIEPRTADEVDLDKKYTPKEVDIITKPKRGRGPPKKPLIDTTKLLTR